MEDQIAIEMRKEEAASDYKQMIYNYTLPTGASEHTHKPSIW